MFDTKDGQEHRYDVFIQTVYGVCNREVRESTQFPKYM